MFNSTLSLRSAALGVLGIFLAASFTGCATYNRIAAYPTPKQNTTVAIAAKKMSKMSELPLGAYYDEQRHIIVSGHQKGLGVGMMFGLVGVIVADQANKSSGATHFGAAAAKGSDLGSLLDELVVDAMSEGAAKYWTKGSIPAGLELTPYAMFTVEQGGTARLYAMLRAEVPGKNGGDPVWSGRYFARAPGEFPLQADGWMQGDRFSSGMRFALSRALAACVADTQGELTGTKTVTAKGHYPYLNKDFELRAILVQEAPDYVVAKLAVGDVMVLAGTHVLNRADYEIKPASFNDPRKK